MQTLWGTPRTESETARVPGGLRPSLAPALLNVTEAAALACGRHLGRDDADRAREAATTVMLDALEKLGVRGRVVLGPHDDEMPSHGTVVGPPGELQFDLAAYPVEGAALVGGGLPGAMSILVAVEPGTFPDLPSAWYMERIVAGPGARGALDLHDPLEENLRRVAFARNARVTDLAVAVRDLPRHQDLIQEVRNAGARVVLLMEGEIACTLLAAADGTGIDAMVGIGGLQETIISACAVSALGGEIHARLWPGNDEERELAGDQVRRIFKAADLSPDLVEVAVTGITDSPLLHAVWYGSRESATESLSMSTRSNTVRRVKSSHRLLRNAAL
jgi:fructose-1,6-bisphosphatase II